MSLFIIGNGFSDKGFTKYERYVNYQDAVRIIERIYIWIRRNRREQ
jgi:hypothetical protein